MNDIKELLHLLGAALLLGVASFIMIAVAVLALVSPIALVVWVFGKAIGAW